MLPLSTHFFFFFNDTATTEIYTLSLHDALPISPVQDARDLLAFGIPMVLVETASSRRSLERTCLRRDRSEEHTSELQSQSNLVCRLLLEKKKKQNKYTHQDNLKTNRVKEDTILH